ncbi:MAG: hypothetical protein QM788_01870 [Roseateles sp.]|uniref:hypothetical protein n=1 Tax=Roseateles sp. TaxID=1971397 RepID=UPI0039EB5272
MKKFFIAITLAIGLSIFLLWLACLGTSSMMDWLEKASPRTVRLLAHWGWLGGLLAAIPAIFRRTNRDN